MITVVPPNPGFDADVPCLADDPGFE